ncbi:MAG: YgiT-type zinc finger protein [Candidatus Desulfaltia sp.]|nr:YgiT-type zinc finger protein [Candidatus Desulfaltia sp.]
MKCYLCSGEMKKEMVAITRYKNDYYYLIEDVPAMVCEQCGEKWFSMNTVVNMDKMMEKPLDPGEKYITVPVRKYASGTRGWG